MCTTEYNPSLCLLCHRATRNESVGAGMRPVAGGGLCGTACATADLSLLRSPAATTTRNAAPLVSQQVHTGE